MSEFRSPYVQAGTPYVTPTVYGGGAGFPAAGYGFPQQAFTQTGFAPAGYGGFAPAFAPQPYGAEGYNGYDMSNLANGTPQFVQTMDPQQQWVVPAVSPAVLGAAPTVTAGGVVPTVFAGTVGNPVVPPTASYVRPAAPQFAEATQYARYVHPFPRQRTQARESKRGFGLMDSWRRQASPEELHAWVYNPTPPSDDYF
jgi:hypothetical protein